MASVAARCRRRRSSPAVVAVGIVVKLLVPAVAGYVEARDLGAAGHGEDHVLGLPEEAALTGRVERTHRLAGMSVEAWLR